GMFLRLNHVSSDVSKRGSDVSETFGHLTFWLGFWNTGYGYGWCAQASNFSCGFAFATSFANIPGEIVSELPGSGLSRPWDDVSPIATSALSFPALIPLYAAAASFAYPAGPMICPFASNWGQRNCPRFDSFQIPEKRTNG